MGVTTHGMTYSTEWRSWIAMRQRCFNEKSQAFRYYGGRGISVCDAWRDDFATFVADIGRAPSAKHTVDRLDPNGHYEPLNCVWATPLEQGASRRNNVMLEAMGERFHVSEWARRTGIPEDCLRTRVRRGWAHERAVTELVQQHSPRRRAA